ncbi:hypothetical protein [Seohaeicola zhoushanensis]|uniref:Uncharacterized protein n=1 Tax=Seohaeicola zhoushanensis TaxID=1569283 RepID=A0A8J3M6Y4_9RHOB|nr:hypothetical protein [Seohaeicola zhoushanensis]GHF33188.1 hypothetical protein GCM10017056_00750 [Seohaeicola zhoushanensis]
MTDQPSEDPMAWLDDPSLSLAPSARTPRKKPARPKPPSEDELRKALKDAPEAAKVKPKAKGKGHDDGTKRRTGDAPGSSGDDRGAKGKGRGSSGGGGDRPPAGRARGEIFENCPVTPLGVNGDLCFYLDVLGQLRSIKKHEAQMIQSLFGRDIPRLCHAFPQWRQTPSGGFERVPNRFDQTSASLVMFQAVSECGVFNPDNAVRGVGAWTDDEGALVYHMGDQVLVDGKAHKPGRVGSRIYPAAAPIPHPAPTAEAPDPVPELLRVLRTWNWTNPEIHPTVALGMICVQMLCGALDWRPVFWLLAPAASGKSEFQKLLKLIHGDDGLVQSNDATERGITSKLKHSSLPVSLDELEPGDERSTKERDIIKLARVAASGGEWFRGSADQSSVGGKVYSSFLFSSILIPGVMKSQDVQRLIRLEMKPLKEGAAKLALVPKDWRSRGAILKRLLIDRWHSWPARMAVWRHALEKAGVRGRDADNWGTVLAMADMASHDELPNEDDAAELAHKVSFLAAAGREETMNDSEALLLHLMGQILDPYRKGELHTIAQWVQAAAGLPGAPTNLVDEATATDRERCEKVNAKLAKFGLRVYGTKDKAQLFIANKKIPALNELFKGTEWHGGVWQQSTSRIPGAEPVPQPRTLAGIQTRGYLVPFASIPGLMSFPMDRDDRAPTTPQTSPGAADDGSSIDEWG